MIDKDTIERLREQVDLHGVISRFVDLKKSGANWIGRCPFHDDRTPSFTVPVAPTGRPFFHCFGCGAHGDAIEFLQKHRGLSFTDAVKELAGEIGLAIGQAKAKRPPLKATARFTPAPAAKEGHQALDEAALVRLAGWQLALPGSPAEQYLQTRKIPLAVAQAVGAGFLPAGEYMGLNAEGKPTGYGPRIVFPHTLPDGRIVNLYGRSTDPDADKGLKHRHLPRAKGLLNADALALPGELWIVEGAFDALALMAAGVQKVIAVFGLDGFDWRWLGRQDLMIATDRDDAGEQAAQKMLLEAAYRGMKARRLPAEAFGGHKDAAAAYASGVLQIDAYRPPTQAAEAPAGAADKAQGIAQLVAGLGHAPDAIFDYVHGDRWMQFKVLAARFCTMLLADALAAGWTVEELFSLPWNSLGTDAGAIWTLAGSRVDQIEVQAEVITATTETGSRLTYRKAKVTGSLPWRYVPWLIRNEGRRMVN